MCILWEIITTIGLVTICRHTKLIQYYWLHTPTTLHPHGLFILHLGVHTPWPPSPISFLPQPPSTLATTNLFSVCVCFLFSLVGLFCFFRFHICQAAFFLSLPDLFHLDNTHNPLNNFVFPWKIYLSYGTNFLGWMISNIDLSVSLIYNTSVRTKSIIWGLTKMWIMGVTI